MVRHGRTDTNERGIMSGHYQAVLTPEGRKANETVAEKLKDVDVDIFYSSDLIRAVETAEQLMKHHPSVEHVKRKDLRERHFGIYTGMPKPEHWKTTRCSEWEAPSGESWEDVKSRVDAFVKELKGKHMDDTVVMVGHGGFLCIMTSVLLGEKSYEARLDAGAENSVPVFIEVTESSTRII